MEKRKLGVRGPEVPAVCLGANVFGWTIDEAQSFRILDAAYDAGLTFIDTADVYSRWAPGHIGGESETIIGRWMAKTGKRGGVTIATKVGMDMGDGKKGLRGTYIRQAVESSLFRLQTDVIDLYQAHQDDKETALEETLEAFSNLVTEGKVRYLGASNYNGTRLKEAVELSRKHRMMDYVSLQPHYNLVEREAFETDLLPVVKEFGIGVIPYFSLAAGFLTGKYRNAQDGENAARGGTVKKYFNDWGFGVVAALEEVANDLDSTPARVALAWLLAQPGVTAPIASATKVEHIVDLVEATRLRLDGPSLEKLNNASSGKPVAVTA